MGYSQSKKLTDAEKRLQMLKLQLYGKEINYSEKIKKTDNLKDANSSTLPTSSLSADGIGFLNHSELIQSTDPHYLRKDLIKIFILAFLAISTQLILYFSLNHGLIKF